MAPGSADPDDDSARRERTESDATIAGHPRGTLMKHRLIFLLLAALPAASRAGGGAISESSSVAPDAGTRAAGGIIIAVPILGCFPPADEFRDIRDAFGCWLCQCLGKP